MSGFEGWNRQKSGVSTVYQRKLSNVDRCLCVQRLGITTYERTACQIACTGMGSLKIVTIAQAYTGINRDIEQFNDVRRVRFVHLPLCAPLETSAQFSRLGLICNSCPMSFPLEKTARERAIARTKALGFCSLPCLVLAAVFFVPWPRDGRPMAPVRGEVNPHTADGYSISVQPAGTSTTTTTYTMTGTY